MTKVAVILSGCGYLDGAEIREAVLTLLYLDQQGADVEVFAPDIDQHHVVNHITMDESANDTRNVLVESARIARSKISELGELDSNNFDALVIPGGYGVAKNLSDLAFKGPEATPLTAFTTVIESFLSQNKPVGAICITPAVLVAVIKKGKVTIGEDEGTASCIQALGGKHENKASDEICIDDENNIISCSAYMREDKISAIANGIEKLVKETLNRCA